MSSRCLVISVSSSSKGPVKLVRVTSNASGPAGLAGARTRASSGGIAARHQLTGEATVRLRTGVGGGIGGDRLARHRRIRELHRARDLGGEELVAEGLADTFDDLAGVQGPPEPETPRGRHPRHDGG